MTLALPRPCRYADVSAAGREGRLPELALVADVGPDELAASIGAWHELLPSTRLIVFHIPELRAVFETPALQALAITACEVTSWDALPSDARTLACPVWASCAAYDAYGVLVKDHVEEPVRRMLARNAGMFLVHDPAYGVVRHFDSAGLHDRVHRRGGRLRMYRRLCATVNALARVASRISTAEPVWRKVP